MKKLIYLILLLSLQESYNFAQPKEVIKFGENTKVLEPENITTNWYLNHPKLSWKTNNENNISYYQIWKEVEGSGNIVATIPHNPNIDIHSWIDSKVTKPGRFDPIFNYVYKVKAVNNLSKSSLFSKEVCISGTGEIWKPINYKNSEDFIISTNISSHSKIIFETDSTICVYFNEEFEDRSYRLSSRKYSTEGIALEQTQIIKEFNNADFFPFDLLQKGNTKYVVSEPVNASTSSAYLSIIKLGENDIIICDTLLDIGEAQYSLQIIESNTNNFLISLKKTGYLNLIEIDSSLSVVKENSTFVPSNLSSGYRISTSKVLISADKLKYYVFFSSRTPDYSDSKLQLVVLNNDFEEIENFTIKENIRNLYYFSVARFNDSSFVLHINYKENEIWKSYLLQVNENSEILNEIELFENQSISYSYPRIDINEENKIVVASEDSNIFAQRFDSQLIEVGNEFTIGDSNEGFVKYSSSIEFSSDNIVITWEQFQNHEYQGLFGKIISYQNPTSTNGSLNPTVENFKLHQNYPNPFNPSTEIKFTIPQNSHVKLELFNTLGEKVATLINKEMYAGTHNYQLSINNYQLPSGVYFYKLQSGSFVETKKMVLVK